MCRTYRVVLAASAALLLQPLATAAQGGVSEDPSRRPRPALIAPRAASALLLDVARSGKGGVVAGARGNILLSADGRDWQQVAVPVDATLTRLHFFDERHGWAVGYDGTLLRTEDGGSTWTLLQFDPDWGRPYFDLHFFDRDHGLLVGANGSLLATNDGGRTLSPIESEAFEDQPNLYNLVALGDGSLLIAGERGFLARSRDRGASWQRLRSPYTGSYFGALPIGQSGVLVFGLRGNAFYAADLDAVEPLSAEALQALRDAALDPGAASSGASPVTEVSGWRALASEQVESLFDALVTADGRVLLVGMNGHVMQADLDGGRLVRLPVVPDNNMNAGIADGDALIVVGTAGVQRVALP
ncbi:WD40/YVTN/BNR-like repeat-containing protein [Sinimarinibacterium thermocellulolyticum]|uniref:YCF48-related protein n=1 Tax=Sinimarinibacterium thermocellulolyticum TaxID=3170016 RepID=A0ABV2A9A7_9GAMM